MLQILNNLQSLDEITFRQFKQKSKNITDLFPAHPQRVKAVGVRGGVKLVDETPIAWMFKIHSGTSNILYDAVLEFVGLEKTLEKFVKDKRLWKGDGSGINRSKLALEVFNNVDLRTFCSDPSDLYWGFHFIRSQSKFDAKYGDKQNISPDIRNPKRKGFFCFDDRAQVLTEGVKYKSIKDVKVGDMVYTHKGRLREVTETGFRDVDDIYEIKNSFWYGKYGVTKEHPFLIVEDEPIWTEVDKLHITDTLFVPKLEFVGNIEFDKDLARFLGYFLAEGSYIQGSKKEWNTEEGGREYLGKTGRGYLGSIWGQAKKDIQTAIYIKNRNNKFSACSEIHLTLNLNERNTVALDIENICKKFKWWCRVDECKTKDGRVWLVVVIRDKKAINLCYKYVGRYSEHKVLHKDIYIWDRESQINFISGYWIGDGNLYKNYTQHIITSCNEVISYQIPYLMSLLDVKSCIFKRKTQGENCKPLYYIKLYSEGFPGMFKIYDNILGTDFYNNFTEKKSKHGNYSRNMIEGGHHQLTQKEKVLGKTRVYNISIEEDESYIVCGVAVHNCKHLTLLFQNLSFFSGTFAKFLTKFYNKKIESFELAVKKRDSTVQGAAINLRKKEAEQEEKE